MLLVLDDDALSSPLADGLLDVVLQLLIGPDGDCSPQLVAQQRVEWLGQLAFNRVFVADQQPPEEGEVELSPERASSLAVGRLAVSDPCQRPLEVALSLLEVALDFGQASFGAVNLPCQPFLLALEQIERDGVGVVGVQQLLALREQTDQPALLHSPFALGVQAQLRQFFFEERADRHKLVLRELHGRVVGRDGGLDLLNMQRSQLAVGALLLTPDTDEVRVGAAPAFGVADDQATAALAAEDGALEVVRVFAVALAGQILGGQQLLNPLPRLLIHQRRVLALVEHALVADNADVVGMAQQPVQMRDAQRSGRQLRAGKCRQTSLGQLSQQRAYRPLAGRIRLERPGHQRTSHRIDLDRAALQTIDDLPHVQVANRCLAGRAAVLGLLDASLDDLCRQVAAIELRDRGHDAVQQQTGWRLVNVLADADQLSARLLESQVDDHIIGPVAGQAIDLVDDHVLDAVVLHELEHPLQLRPVCGLSRLAALHELFNHRRLETGGLALAGFELRRKRIAVWLIGLGCLTLARRNAHIHNGRCTFSVFTFVILRHWLPPICLPGPA